MDYNYHTHTYRCGHASGTEREYIEQAIKHGIKVLGFSDHVLYEYKNKEVFDDYFNVLHSLREEYKDRIEIFIGFECEYIKSREEYYRYLLDKKVDYLILGQHYVEYKGKEETWLSDFMDGSTMETYQKTYYRHLKNALKTGLFKYIAHPDWFIFSFEEQDEKFRKFSTKICKLAKKFNVPLEINLNGIKNHGRHPDQKYFYPCENFFKIASEIGNDVIVGIDAHETEFFDKADYQFAEHLIKKYNLHEITRLDIKRNEW